MRNSFLPLALILSGIAFAAEPPPAAPPSREAKEVPPAATQAKPDAKKQPKAAPARIRFKGKAGAPTNCTVTATRNGGESRIRLVSMAPGDEGITQKALPRLWWHQSEATGPRDLEFTLSRMDGPKPKELMRRLMPAMPKGFNCVDFTHKGFNADNIELASGGIYQWTVRLVSEKTAPQVFCRMKADLTTTGESTTGIQELADSGNWYELFDLVSSAAQESTPGAADMAAIRQGLLQQVGLAKALE